MQNYRICLVEDDPNDEHLTLRALRRLPDPPDIIVARNGQQAWDLLIHEDTPVPHLILLDLKLPKIGGLELLGMLRGNPKTAYVPIVILSSSDEPSDVRTSFENHANSYVRKPVGYEEYGARVTQLAQYWLEANMFPATEA